MCERAWLYDSITNVPKAKKRKKKEKEIIASALPRKHFLIIRNYILRTKKGTSERTKNTVKYDVRSAMQADLYKVFKVA